ncbi:MAG: energy-coupling factor transporter transmembrane protein EcfT [Oscillospiraceae bacterium]|nr:energy-coupling factor transporter transmembrane protein EcfT [Oscillospiraceae bacterium]
MELTFYGEDNKGILKFDPRTKFLLFIASGLMSLSSYSDSGAAVYTVVLLAVYALCGKPLSALKSALIFGAVMYLRAVLQNSQGAPPMIVLLVTALTTVFMFGFPSVLSIVILVRTTRISHFLSAFQAMHLPIRMIVPFAVFFRFLPTVAEEWNGVRKAMAFRGMTLSPAEVIRHPLRTVEYVLIPMLFSSMAVMEELAAASMARGMDADTKRSSYEEVRLKAADYVLIVLVFGMTVFAFIMGYSVKGGMNV